MSKKKSMSSTLVSGLLEILTDDQKEFFSSESYNSLMKELTQCVNTLDDYGLMVSSTIDFWRISRQNDILVEFNKLTGAIYFRNCAVDYYELHAILGIIEVWEEILI